MRSIITIVAVLLMCGIASANLVNQEIEDVDLATWIEDYTSGQGETLVAVTDISGLGVRFQASTPTSTSGWFKIGISDDYPIDHIYGFPWNSSVPGFADWTGYTAYLLHFKNNSTSGYINVKIYFCTRSVGDWNASLDVWLAPGESIVRTIDLSGILYLDQVCNIGFELGANYGTDPYQATGFDVTVTASPIPAPSEVWVDDSWAGSYPGQSVGGHVFGYDAFAKIQDGIDAVSGSTVNVAAGTYIENINITKRLTLNGAGSGSDPATNTVVTAAAANVPVVSINASGASDSERLTISNIRVTGGNGSGTYENSGIKFVSGGSYTTFSNVASVGGNQGSGLLARAGTLQYVQVLNCTLSDNGSCGFLAGGSTLSVADLTVTNSDMNHNLAGLYVDGGLNGLTLTGGTFNNNYANADPTNGLGIYITTRVTPPSGTQPIVLSGFTASNNVRGVIFSGGVCGPLLITDANLENNTQEGISLSPNAYVPGPVTLRNVIVTNNPFGPLGLWVVSFRNFVFSNLTIEGCTFNGSRGTTGSATQGKGYGMLLDVLSGATLSNVTVTGCTMQDNNVGVYLRERDALATLTGVSIVVSSIGSNNTGIVVSGNAAAGNSAYYNNIGGNTVMGIQNNDPGPNGTFDASSNSGDMSGSNDPIGTMETDGKNCYDVSVIVNADGLGDAVSENVIYCPWLLVPVISSDGPCPAGDLDGDCDVDFYDCAIMAGNWLVGTED